jgi:NB-ARC domain
VARSDPRVEDDQLILPGGEAPSRLAVGSAAWFAWLGRAEAFAYAGPEGTFGARKEHAGHGRGRAYWRAYRRRGGRLRCVYLGPDAALTPERLRATAAALAIDPSPPAPSRRADGGIAGRPDSAPIISTLPIPLTELIGRRREVDQVRERLGAVRLLTLTGAGGVGKSRLALAVATELATIGSGAVAWVELAALADPALVVRTVAATLGVREAADRPALAMLVEALRDRRLLLALDNCEHLLDACATLAEALLRGCPGVRVLATVDHYNRERPHRSLSQRTPVPSEAGAGTSPIRRRDRLGGLLRAYYRDAAKARDCPDEVVAPFTIISLYMSRLSALGQPW